MLALREEFLDVCGEIILEVLNDSFDNPDQFGFPSLSDEWEKKKARLGQDPRFWHATGELLDALHASKQGDTLFVGWGDEVSSEKGTPLRIIVAALEFGEEDLGIPARPVLRESAPRIRARLLEALPALARKHLNAETLVR